MSYTDSDPYLPAVIVTIATFIVMYLAGFVIAMVALAIMCFLMILYTVLNERRKDKEWEDLNRWFNKRYSNAGM